MPTNDSLPRFVVRWSDRRTGRTYESPAYLVHEEADVHFADVIADTETLSAEEVEKSRRGDVTLRKWAAPAYHSV